MRFARHGALLFLFCLGGALPAAAARIDTAVLFDTDNSSPTGCTVFGIPGIEHVVTVSAETVPPPGRVVSVVHQPCAGGSLAPAVVLDSTGWPAPFDGVTGIGFLEMRVPFSTLGVSPAAAVRFAFVFTDGTNGAALVCDAEGHSIRLPSRGARRRTVSPPERVMTLDGNPADWAGIPPLALGGVAAGSGHLRLVNAYTIAVAGAIFFRFDVQSSPAAPTAVNDTFTAPASGPVAVTAPGVLANDFDPAGQSLTAGLVAAPENGVVALSGDGSFVYTPDGASVARDSFTYQANNGSQPSNVARVTLQLGDDLTPNRRPTAADDAFAIRPGETQTRTAPGLLQNDSDPDGDPLRAVPETSPQHGILTLNPDGSFRYVHDGSRESDRFTYVVNDGTAASDPAAVLITIIRDTAPTAVNDRYTVAEGETLNVSAPGVMANDVNPGSLSLTMTVVTEPLHGNLAARADGSFTYVHDGSETAGDAFTYTISDGSQVSSPATVVIDVNAVDDPPVAAADTYAGSEDATLTIAAPGLVANDSDAESDALTASAVTGPANGVLTLSADGSFTYTPNADFNGADAFTYRLSDGVAFSNVATVTLTVAAVNDPPRFTAGGNVTSPEDVAYGAPWAVSVSAGPPDEGGQALAFTVTNDNNSLFAAQPAIAANGTLTFTPAANANGSATVTVTLTDDGGGTSASAVQTFTITVTAINDAPSFVKGANVVVLDTAGAQTIAAWATGLSAGPPDEAAQALDFVVSNDNSALFSVPPALAANGTLTFTPISGATGLAMVTVAVHDNGGAAGGGVDTSAAQTFTIDVQKIPIITSANAATFTVGAAGTFSVTAPARPAATIAESGALPAGVTFGGSTLSGSPAAGTGGVYAITFVATNVHGSSAPQNFTLTVNEAPQITAAAASQTICSGATVTFTAAASGFPAPAVQWQVSTDGGATFTTIAGATSGSYAFATTAADNGRQYRAVFTNGMGTAQSTATLTVTTAAAVAANPASATFCEGSPASFMITASGNPAPSVQWQISTDGGVTFADVAGATSTTYSFIPALAGNGNRYRAVLTNSCGTATSSAATLTVQAAPSVTASPASQTICAGATATFTAAATGTPAPTVQWQVSTDGGATFADIPGATSTTYAFAVSSADEARQYRAVFTNGCATATTAAATLTVTSAPAVTASPIAQTVCEGATVTLTAASSGTPTPAVQWQVSTNAGGSFSNIPGATSPTYSFTAAAVNNNDQYRAVFTNSCGTATSAAAALTVNVAAVVTSSPASQTICAGGTATFTAAATGTPAPTVQWQVSTNGGASFSDIVGATSSTYSFTTTSADNARQYRAVFTNSCAVATTAAATLTVTSPPVVTASPAAQLVCDGATTTFTAAASGSPAPAVQWQVSTNGGVSFNNIPGATAPTYIFTAAAVNNNDQYRAVFTNSCGTATTAAAALTVDSPVVMTANPASASFCDGTTASFTIAATNATSMQWQVSTDNGLTFNNIGGATAATYSFTATSAANGNRYRAVASSFCGAVTSSAATLTVTTASAVTASPSPQTVCDGVTASFTVGVSGSPTPAIQWQVSTNGGGTFSDIGGATASTYSFAAAASDNGNQYRAVLTNSCGTATSAAAALTVTTAPAVTTHPSTQTFCEGTTATFTVAASGSPAPTVQWKVSTDGGLTFNDIGGATSLTLSFPAASADNARQYRAVFTNSCGTATTNAATLTVTTSAAVTASPTSATFCEGATASFTAAASGSPAPAVQWQVSTNGGTSYSNIVGATAATYSFTAALTDNGHLYRAVFTNSCATATTTAATLTATSAPAVTVNPTAQAGCNGGSVTFTAAASGTPTPAVQWEVSTNGGVNWSSVAGATSSSYTFTPVPADNNNRYRAVFTNSCGTATSTGAVLTVGTSATASDPAGTTLCAGATASFTTTVGGTPAPSIQWQVSTDAGATFTNIVGATSATYNFTSASADNGKQYRAVVTNACSTVTTAAATLTVNAAPAITTPPASQTICNGSTATFTVAATGTPTPAVQWQVSTDGGTTFTDIGGATTTTLSFTAVAADNGKKYQAVLTNSCGTVTTSVATLTVPTISVSGTPPAGTFNTAYTTTFTASGSSGFTFSVSAGTIPTGLTLASGGTLSGTPSAAGTFNFTIRATDSAGCSSTQSFSIEIAPNVQNDAYTTVGNTQLYVSGVAGAPSTPAVVTGTSLTANDGGSVTVTAVSGVSTTNGGSITIDSAGRFLYTPPVQPNSPAAHITSDSYTYTATAGGVSRTATITFTLSNVVWYVNNSGLNGDGRSQNPFNTLSSAQTASSSNDSIFVHTGSGSTSGNITLKSGQTLWGQGSTFTLSPLSISAGTAPTLSGTITLASGVTTNGFNMSTGASTAISGNSVTGLGVTVGTVTTTTGIAVSIGGSGNTGTMTFTTVNTNGATKGISLTNFTGTFAVNGTGGSCSSTTTTCTGGLIQSASTRGVEIIGSSGVTLKNMRFLSTATTVAGSCVANISSGSNSTCNAPIYLSGSSNVTLNTVFVDGSSQMGINGNSVSTFTMTNSEIRNVGSVTGDQSAIAFQNLSDTCSITGSSIHDNDRGHNVIVTNNTGTLNLTFSANTVSNVTTATPATSDGFLAEASSSANMTVAVNNTGGTCSFDKLYGNGVAVRATGTSPVSATLSGCSITRTTGVFMELTGTSMTANVTSNTIRNKSQSIDGFGNGSNGITVAKGSGPGTITATITGNQIQRANCGGGCIGIDGGGYGASGTANFTISNNTVEHVDSIGIRYVTGQGSTRNVVTMQGNAVTNPDASGNYAIDLEGGTTPGDNPCIAANIGTMSGGSGNTITNGSTGFTWINISGVPTIGPVKSFGTFKLFNYTGSTDAQAAAWVVSNNPGTSSDAFGGFTGGTSCP